MIPADPEIWPRITVVTPSFRQAQFLETTILSVLGQCYPNLEYMIMDGGSDDGSVEIIRRYESQLAYWQSQKDAGQSDAINQGFARATGDILCWLNSDDYFLPGTLRNIARQLAPHVDQPRLLYGSCFYFRESDFAVRVLKARPFDAELLRETDYIYQPSSYWTKRLWDETGPLETNLHFGFDWDWYIRASKIGTFISSPEIYSAYRRHAAHKSGSGGDKRCQELLEVVSRHGSEAQIRAYREAAEYRGAFERRNRLRCSLQENHIPAAGLIAAALSPGLWQKECGSEGERFRRCMSMLLST